VSGPAADALVLDVSAVVEALLGTETGMKVRERMRAHRLHAPAHMDAEVLSALGRIYRAGEADQSTISDALQQLAAAPIQRHPLSKLLAGAWARRDRQRLVDALYVELASALAPVPLLTTDARLARSHEGVELVSCSTS
jgi:predicted nucleic acid-binding protein